MKALVTKFKKPSPIQLPTNQPATPHATAPQEYHKCAVYSASFTSISRLLSHSQIATCSKSSCKYCDYAFQSKNKVHEHLRNRDCPNLPRNSPTTSKAGLTPLPIESKPTSDADIAIKREGGGGLYRLHCLHRLHHLYLHIEQCHLHLQPTPRHQSYSGQRGFSGARKE